MLNRYNLDSNSRHNQRSLATKDEWDASYAARGGVPSPTTPCLSSRVMSKLQSEPACAKNEYADEMGKRQQAGGETMQALQQRAEGGGSFTSVAGCAALAEELNHMVVAPHVHLPQSCHDNVALLRFPDADVLAGGAGIEKIPDVLVVYLHELA